MSKFSITNKIKKTESKRAGFTLLIAIVVTSMLLIVSFVVVNIAFKQIILSDAAVQSQFAFYNADSGVECAIYWDIPSDGSLSFFDPYRTPVIPVSCGGNSVSVSNTGIVSGYSTSTIIITLTKGCAEVKIAKKVGSATTTTIDSRGYNSCGVVGARRYERGITLTY